MIHLHQFQEVFLLNETLIHLAKNQLIQRAGKARQLWLLTLRWLNSSMAKNVGLGVYHSPNKIKSGKPIDLLYCWGGGGTYKAKKPFLKDDFQWNLCMMSLAMTYGYIFKIFTLYFLALKEVGCGSVPQRCWNREIEANELSQWALLQWILFFLK